nr:hypothetical protein [Tanacetum cinerariifolium]
MKGLYGWRLRAFHVSGGLEIHLAVPHRIASRWGTLLNEEELEEEGYHSNKICIHVEGEIDREEVLETNFEEVPDKSIFEGNSVRHNDVYSEDSFGIYEVLNKKRDGKNIDDKHE